MMFCPAIPSPDENSTDDLWWPGGWQQAQGAVFFTGSPAYAAKIGLLHKMLQLCLRLTNLIMASLLLQVVLILQDYRGLSCLPVYTCGHRCSSDNVRYKHKGFSTAVIWPDKKMINMFEG